MSTTTIEVTPKRVIIDTDERHTNTFSMVLKDEDGDPFTAAMLDSLRLTLVEEATNQVINGRDNQDVLNANGGVLDDETGEFTWTWLPEDTAIVADTPVNGKERHLATFTFKWGDGTREASREVLLIVRNLQSVPQGD